METLEFEQTIFFLGLMEFLVPPPPALGVKVLDSWEYQHSVKAT